jgi:hypothetical protein
MISEQKLLELVVALNAEKDRRGQRPNDFNGVKDNYVIMLDRYGNLVDGGSGLKDGVGICRDTANVWMLTIRPAAKYGPPMRYGNPVELVRSARARKHGPHAYFLHQGEVRRLRNR